MDTIREHEQMFGQMAPTKLFFKCVLPSMVSMGVTSLYTIADGIFVGQFIGASALAAINLVMPLIMISFAVSDMIAVGSSVQISIQLGRRDYREASRIFSFSCVMIEVISVIVGLLGYFLSPGLVRLLGAEGQVASQAVEYMRMYALFAPLLLCFFALDNYLRICGKVRYSMWMNVLVSLGNILLDALFVGVLGWGVASAALASCLCIAAGSLVSVWPFVKGGQPLRFVRAVLRPRKVLNLFANGSSEFFANISSSVCAMLFNGALLALGGYQAVAAFSVVMYIDSIVKSILLGMGDSMQPALSYNYGARNRGRIFALEGRVQLLGAAVSVGTMALMWAFGQPLASLFIEPGQPELLALSVWALRLFSLSYLFSWCGIVSSSFFTAIDRPSFAMVLAIGQALVLPGIGLLILPRLLGLDGVWLTMPAACAAAAVCAGVLMVFAVRELRRKLPKEA